MTRDRCRWSSSTSCQTSRARACVRLVEYAPAPARLRIVTRLRRSSARVLEELYAARSMMGPSAHTGEAESSPANQPGSAPNRPALPSRGTRKIARSSSTSSPGRAERRFRNDPVLLLAKMLSTSVSCRSVRRAPCGQLRMPSRGLMVILHPGGRWSQLQPGQVIVPAHAPDRHPRAAASPCAE